jgi:AcrR family transcriptional regulator
MVPRSRAERREDVTARVVEIGRRHLAERGAAALSLRAVTRDLGMVSSAVYRYVANRDELLTLLLVDAYSEQADAVDAAVAEADGRPWDERLLAAALAFRAWAVQEPARYALLYGSPVPGYAAPPEITVEPGTRVVTTLLGLVADGLAAGAVVDGPGAGHPDRPAGSEPPSSEPPGRSVAPSHSPLAVEVGGALATDLRRVADEVGIPAGPELLARAIHLWASLVGGVSLEVFGQYGADTFTEPSALFEHQVRLSLALLRG